MKQLIIVIATLLTVCMSYALIDEFYTFNATLGTYTPITGTAATAAQDDDGITAAIPLGFVFHYGGTDYNSIKISSNGWIGIGSALADYDYDNDLTSTGTMPVIAPLWDDLSMEAGSVQYLLVGSEPNRVFTVQYTDAAWNYSAVNQFSFQARIYETGKIDLVYGPSTGSPQFATASIGINMSPGGSGWFYSVTPGTPPTASSTVSFNSIGAFPPQGTIFAFLPVMQNPNDLACTAVTGNPTPSLGTATPYQISIANRGTNPQTTYLVKLYKGAGVEVGSVDGTNILAGQTLNYNISWTPTVVGDEVLYGKVILAGDQNASNDQSPNLNVIVQPVGVQFITIGSGNQLSRIPMDFYWRNSLYECLYYAAELGFTNSTISSIAFYNNFVTDLPTGNTKIWLGTTNNADLTGGWIPSTMLTQVFDGIVSYPAGENTITINLQTPFNFTSGNLVLMVNRPMDLEYFSSTDNFKAQTGTAFRTLTEHSDATVYDPANPPTDTEASLQYPKITIQYAPVSSVDDPGTPALVSGLTGSDPNPFQSSTTIRYSLKDSSPVDLGIYNIKGQLVKTLIINTTAAGSHSIVWNGTDDNGLNVSAGIYFCRMQADKHSSIRKLILIK